MASNNNERKNKMSISVVIPCYNYGRFLGEAVESVLKQTKKADEILIMDDCSTDNSKEVALQYEKEGVQYCCNPENYGVHKNFDKGVQQTTGDYVMLLGADNRLRPTYLEKLSQILDNNRNIGVVYTQCAVFGDIAEQVSKNMCWWKHGKRQKEGEFFIWHYYHFDREKLRRRNYIHGSAMYRRECYNQAGGYEACRKTGKPDDWTLWSEICVNNNWDAYYVEKPLLEYRHHSLEQRSWKRNYK